VTIKIKHGLLPLARAKLKKFFIGWKTAFTSLAGIDACGKVVLDARMAKQRDDILQEVFAKCPRPTLARAFGITLQAIHDWRRVPADRVLKIEELTGIRRERLRPDVFGAPRPDPRRMTECSAAA
jgi:hypothetical protein